MTTMANVKNDKDWALYHGIGRRISHRRRVIGLTQQALSEMLGMSRVSVVNVEAGKQVVLLHALPAWAKALKCRIADLLPPQWRSR